RAGQGRRTRPRAGPAGPRRAVTTTSGSPGAASPARRRAGCRCPGPASRCRRGGGTPRRPAPPGLATGGRWRSCWSGRGRRRGPWSSPRSRTRAAPRRRRAGSPAPAPLLGVSWPCMVGYATYPLGYATYLTRERGREPMRVFGMNYDTGFVYPGSTTHEPWDPETVRRDLRVIRDELHCDAVRLTGGIQDRLELAAQLAAEAGLEVWYCPFTNGLDRDELMAFVLDGAERAERLRRSGASVVYLTGSEISMFTNGFMPGRDLAERLELLGDPVRLREAIPAARAAVREFLAEAVPAVRERFGGPIGYASLPFEDVDWAPFDIIAS